MTMTQRREPVITEKIDWYKVYVLSWAKKNQHIRWEDHVKAEALAMARETAKRIKRKELLLAAEPPKLQVQPSEAKPQDDGEAQGAAFYAEADKMSRQQKLKDKN